MLHPDRLWKYTECYSNLLWATWIHWHSALSYWNNIYLFVYIEFPNGSKWSWNSVVLGLLVNDMFRWTSEQNPWYSKNTHQHCRTSSSLHIALLTLGILEPYYQLETTGIITHQTIHFQLLRSNWWCPGTKRSSVSSFMES